MRQLHVEKTSIVLEGTLGVHDQKLRKDSGNMRCHFASRLAFYTTNESAF